MSDNLRLVLGGIVLMLAGLFLLDGDQHGLIALRSAVLPGWCWRRSACSGGRNSYGKG